MKKIKIRSLQTDGFFRKLPVPGIIEDDNLGPLNMWRSVLDYALVESIRTTVERSYFKEDNEEFDEVCYLACVDTTWASNSSRLFFNTWDTQNKKEP